MNHSHAIRAIQDIVLNSGRSYEQCTAALFHVLMFTCRDTNEQVTVEKLCRDRLIPILVYSMRGNPETVSRLRRKLDDIKVPQLDQQDVEAMMLILRGRYRQAARSFFTAVNSGVRPEEISRALQPLTGQIRPDPERDPDALRMNEEERERALYRLLRFRDDIPQSTIFVMFWNLCVDLQVPMNILCTKGLYPILIGALGHRTFHTNVVLLLQRELKIIPHQEHYEQHKSHKYQETKEQNQRHKFPSDEDVKYHKKVPSQKFYNEKQIKEANDILKVLDQDKDGKITQMEVYKCLRQGGDEVKRALEDLAMPTEKFRNNGPDDEPLRNKFQKRFQEIDVNEDKYLDLEELLYRLRTVTVA
jgi:hypothetical protein